MNPHPIHILFTICVILHFILTTNKFVRCSHYGSGNQWRLMLHKISVYGMAIHAFKFDERIMGFARHKPQFGAFGGLSIKFTLVRQSFYFFFSQVASSWALVPQNFDNSVYLLFEIKYININVKLNNFEHKNFFTLSKLKFKQNCYCNLNKSK